jgi:hypothetical protein
VYVWFDWTAYEQGTAVIYSRPSERIGGVKKVRSRPLSESWSFNRFGTRSNATTWSAGTGSLVISWAQRVHEGVVFPKDRYRLASSVLLLHHFWMSTVTRWRNDRDE